jgi:hypothetical protein
MKYYRHKSGFILISLFTFLFLYGCNENNLEFQETDDAYLREVIANGYSGVYKEDDDLIFSERNDLDDAELSGDSPADSVLKWGKFVTNISRNITITNEGDTIKIVHVTTTVTGKLVIVKLTGNTTDTIHKPYTMQYKRDVIFKRIARTPRPRLNWRLYKISFIDGESKTPQIGTSRVEMNKIEVYVNGVQRYTFNGPDFTQNIFTTRYFGGAGIPELNRNDEVKLKVYLYSVENQPEIVFWRWGRRKPGFNREIFQLISETPSGNGFDRIYEKTFSIGHQHMTGRFNGAVVAMTHNTLYSNQPQECAADIAAAPYRVLP